MAAPRAQLPKFTAEEVKALYEFHNKSRNFYAEVTLIESALYACMCGLQSVQLDTSHPFENYSEISTCYGNLLHVLIANLYRETTAFDVAMLNLPDLRARLLQAELILTDRDRATQARSADVCKTKGARP